MTWIFHGNWDMRISSIAMNTWNFYIFMCVYKEAAQNDCSTWEAVTVCCVDAFSVSAVLGYTSAKLVQFLEKRKSSMLSNWNRNMTSEFVYFCFNKYITSLVLTQQSKFELWYVCVCLGSGPCASVVLLPRQPDWRAGGEPGEHGVWWLQVCHPEGPRKSGWDRAAFIFLH